MKLKTIILIVFITTNWIYSQIDEHGNLIFNSELISEEVFENFELTFNYYTISNNISNRSSSVYVSDNPTLVEYVKFARNLPSYFFTIHKEEEILIGIILLQKNKRNKTTFIYNIVNPNTGKSIEIPCNVLGGITEKRVEELEKIKIDTTAKILSAPNIKLYVINKIGYRIQPYDDLKSEVIEIAKQILDSESNKNENIEDYIRKETLGGKLDFKKKLDEEGKGNTLIVYDGIEYNSAHYVILLWGGAVKRLGIKSDEEAISLWENINERKMTDPEKKALITGFKVKIK